MITGKVNTTYKRTIRKKQKAKSTMKTIYQFTNPIKHKKKSYLNNTN
ncbi:hypothetical protein HanXRQr2_Chr06g0244801 [Helianthus annuus]|uniref:Uncharacterized protein n=1 Tax=Helianthus annuus TaxID=4232 RepID=A0A9K3NI02_HELAN|nr:hypothetical protein HanXRQr2_Chr06g0244801 [Helianthus annuus]